MQKPYRHFDLPTGHLINPALDFVPHKARSQVEVDRRRQLPKGSLLAEQQHQGILVASQFLEPLQGDDLSEGAHFVALAGIGSAFYSSARYANRMRRRLDLPEMAREEDDWRSDHQTALTVAKGSLALSADLAAEWSAAAKSRSPRRMVIGRQLGRSLGDSGLQLACLDLASMVGELSAFDAQDIARSECLAILQRSRSLGEHIGAYPSMAQLAQPTSPLAVHISNEASNPVYEAFQTALSQHAMAA